MDKVFPLSVYMENNRPLITDLLNIYIAVLECIENSRDEGVIFHMEYIKYDIRSEKVYLPVGRAVNTAYTPWWLFECMRASLRYAGSDEKALAENVIYMYRNNGSRECLNMVKNYKKRIEKSHRFVTIWNALFVVVVFFIILIYYRMYGICFY